MSTIHQVQALGLMLIFAGIAIYLWRRDAGANEIKIAGLEISVSAPSILLSVIGIMVFCFPLTSYYHDRPAVTPPPVEYGAGNDMANPSKTADAPSSAPPVAKYNTPTELCARDRMKDEAKFWLAYDDLFQRPGKFYSELIRWPDNSAGQQVAARQYRERSKFLMSSAMKDSSPRDDVNTMEDIVRRWYPKAITCDAIQVYRISEVYDNPYKTVLTKDISDELRATALMSISYTRLLEEEELDRAIDIWLAGDVTDPGAFDKFMAVRQAVGLIVTSMVGATAAVNDRDRPFLSVTLCPGARTT